MKLFICAIAALSLASCGQVKSTDGDTVTTAMSGAWAGTGSMTTNGGGSTPCQNIALTLTYTNIDVTVSNIAATCTGSTVNQTTVTFQYSGGILYYAGTAVGTIGDSEIDINYNIAGQTESLEFLLTDPTHITFTESASGSGSSMTLNGTLVHQ